MNTLSLSTPPESAKDSAQTVSALDHSNHNPFILPSQVSHLQAFNLVQSGEEFSVYSLRDAPPELRSLIGTLALRQDSLDQFHHQHLQEVLILHVKTPSREGVTKIKLSTYFAEQAHVQALLIVAEQHTKVAIYDDLDSSVSLKFASRTVEIVALDHSHVSHVLIQHLKPESYLHLRKASHVGANAHVGFYDLHLGSSHCVLRSDVILKGVNASTLIQSGIVGAATQQFERSTTITHDAAHTRSRLLSRHVLAGNSQAHHRGTISISPKMNSCDSHQQDNTLLIGDHARIETVPILEIANQDVRSSHAATITHLDEDSLFYLMSRAIPYAQATESLIDAFLSPVIDSLPYDLSEIRQEIKALISAEVRYV